MTRFVTPHQNITSVCEIMLHKLQAQLIQKTTNISSVMRQSDTVQTSQDREEQTALNQMRDTHVDVSKSDECESMKAHALDQSFITSLQTTSRNRTCLSSIHAVTPHISFRLTNVPVIMWNGNSPMRRLTSRH